MALPQKRLLSIVTNFMTVQRNVREIFKKSYDFLIDNYLLQAFGLTFEC